MLTYSVTLVAVLAVGATSRTPALEDVSFSEPAQITNRFAPFAADSVRVLNGSREGKKAVCVETHLRPTRTFVHQRTQIECRVLEQKEFENGELVEISLNYLAQDDQGNVWYFGEVSNIVENGQVVGVEDDSWLVGGATLASDSPDIKSAARPAIYMPAELNLGDTFSQDPSASSTDVLTVVKVDVKVKVPGGKFTNAVKLRESSDDDDEDDEFKWVVPGVGIVREQAADSKARLTASSLR